MTKFWLQKHLACFLFGSEFQKGSCWEIQQLKAAAGVWRAASLDFNTNFMSQFT